MNRVPLISLVIVSYNQARYLEGAIASVLSQGYPNLRVGVVDGGSTDGSRRILEKYRGRLSYVIIERDRGQADALNKGLRLCGGDADTIVGRLNSDDVLRPGALRAVGEHFTERPESQWVAGHCGFINEAGDPAIDPNSGRRSITATSAAGLAHALLRDEPFALPPTSTFWRRRLLDKHGGFDSSLRYAFDLELACRFLAEGYRPGVIDRGLSSARVHREPRTAAQWSGWLANRLEIERRFAGRLAPRDRIRARRRIGQRRRQLAVITARRRPWLAVLRRPWWLASPHIRRALGVGKLAQPPMRETPHGELAFA